tara:strand:+ start:2240 stop:3427 length:1188 start_codon:yes stop_codon:yes gene_type:complete
MNILSLIGRENEFFSEDVLSYEKTLKEIIRNSNFLIIGGAGSIGQALTKEIFKRDPKSIHVIDISENNMVELVREIRSTIGYKSGEFKTFSLDFGSAEFDALIQNEGPYDFIFNLSAMKHVRSERDPYTIMRMIKVNILNTIRCMELTKSFKLENFFCVSTDKAANPVNMMGASKRIMEMFLMKESHYQKVSMARFANVAFSDGSLLHGFNQRFLKKQPFSAPQDVKRYFITPQESGELCLLSGLLGNNKEIFFPKLSADLNLISFSDLAIKYLEHQDFEPYICSTEEEARDSMQDLFLEKKWPCFFFNSDTTGEKSFEEFYTEDEELLMDKFKNIGIIKANLNYDEEKLYHFETSIYGLLEKQTWSKDQIKKIFQDLLPNFDHIEKNKNLDQRM